MTTRDFERAVARATGESRRIVRQRGFQPLFADIDEDSFFEDRPPLCVDWDALDEERSALFPAA